MTERLREATDEDDDDDEFDRTLNLLDLLPLVLVLGVLQLLLELPLVSSSFFSSAMTFLASFSSALGC